MMERRGCAELHLVHRLAESFAYPGACMEAQRIQCGHRPNDRTPCLGSRGGTCVALSHKYCDTLVGV